MSNLGKWERWYSMLGEDPEPYGDSPSYQLAADFVKGLAVADWGCGKGWMRRFIAPELYHGVDGSASPFADEVVDLTDYHTPSPAIILRHVLEHDYNWKLILRNAVAAAQQRLVVVLFTPPVDVTTVIAFNDEPSVPDIAFNVDDIIDEMHNFNVVCLEQPSERTQYKVETMIYATRMYEGLRR